VSTGDYNFNWDIGDAYITDGNTISASGYVIGQWESTPSIYSSYEGINLFSCEKYGAMSVGGFCHICEKKMKERFKNSEQVTRNIIQAIKKIA
jgi:hypothetical protein